ncbi:hypothetical protein [Streptomyces sp. NBC_00057]|uniref:hypothetical protein n=1 Tax=Streptomyces sp. NBC_00057 TaxID=2975634 RepID=UPI003244CBDF
MTAVCALALGAALSSTGPAWAAEWKNTYWRDATDGDAGGVSGSAARYWSGNDSIRAYIGFLAKGEHFTVYNDTSVRATYWATANGWPVLGGDIDPGDYGTANLDIDEGETISIKICVKDRGCATLDTLKA